MCSIITFYEQPFCVSNIKNVQGRFLKLIFRQNLKAVGWLKENL